MSFERTLVIEPTVRELAKAFWEMSSDEQAIFFVECARLCIEESEPIARQLQWLTVGKVLRREEFADARDIILDIVEGWHR